MSLKSLMQSLEKRLSDTPDIPEKCSGDQRKALIHTVCAPDTPDTPRFGDTRVDEQFGQFGKAVNDAASAAPVMQGSLKSSVVAPSDPDRWCWPHSDAMNGQEIDIFTARLERFTDKGVSLQHGERLANRLVTRDREVDERRSCLECARIHGSGRWRCGNAHRAAVTTAGLSAELVLMLQHCDQFNAVIRNDHPHQRFSPNAPPW